LNWVKLIASLDSCVFDTLLEHFKPVFTQDLMY